MGTTSKKALPFTGPVLVIEDQDHASNLVRTNPPEVHVSIGWADSMSPMRTSCQAEIACHSSRVFDAGPFAAPRRCFPTTRRGHLYA